MIKAKEITNQSTWENFVLSSNQSNFLQSWHWGLFNQDLKHQITRMGFYQQGKLVGVALLIKIKAKRGSYLECPGGPIINWQDNSQVKEVLKLLKQFANQEKLSFIRIRPNILVGSFKPSAYGLFKSPMHLHAETTWVLDLDSSEEELLSKMRKNTRHAIKQAEKLNIKIEVSKKLSDVDLLYDLQLETVKRKKFVPFTRQFLSQQLKTFQDADQIKLIKASYKGQVLAIATIHFFGPEAVYHYSGSSNQLRHIPVSYAIQWSVIKKAKQMGYKRYNFWGYTDNPKHRFYGPSLFKKGFGGYRLDYLPAHDLPIKPTYWLIYFFETLRRKLRHL
jgi:lipid II:glycine glycyltransferase (peptidoglycan interpeptide bridge formation enzyme)